MTGREFQKQLLQEVRKLHGREPTAGERLLVVRAVRLRVWGKRLERRVGEAMLNGLSGHALDMCVLACEIGERLLQVFADLGFPMAAGQQKQEQGEK